MGVGSGWVLGAGGRPALVNLRAGQGSPGQGRTWEGWPELQGVGGGGGEGGGVGGADGTVPGVWRERQRAGRDSDGAVA